MHFSDYENNVVCNYVEKNGKWKCKENNKNDL